MGDAAHPTRLSQAANTRQYDRIARLYSFLEPLYLIFPAARTRAVVALGLKPGDTVLEIGAGTGRNFRYLVEAVGPAGKVIGLDASPGMLAEARRLVEGEGWSNVELLHQDAGRLELDGEVDGVLFSLSYSAIPEPRPALSRAWERLGPRGRVVILDAGFTDSRMLRLLDPIARLLVKLGPGDAYSDPWADLAAYGEVWTKRFLFDFFYVSVVEKADPASVVRRRFADRGPLASEVAERAGWTPASPCDDLACQQDVVGSRRGRPLECSRQASHGGTNVAQP